MTENLALFVGCVISEILPELELASRRLLAKLGIKTIDLNFGCCPSKQVVAALDYENWLLIAAKNLAMAEEAKADIISLCNGCTQTLKEANYALSNDPEKLKWANTRLKGIGRSYNLKVKVRHVAELLYEMRDKLPIEKKLYSLRLATQPGCHLLRPSSIIRFDNDADPRKLDELISITGAEVIDYSTKTICCGAALVHDKEAFSRLTRDKLECLKGKADALVTACPDCFLTFDHLQGIAGLDFKMPVLFITQLIGIAAGLNLEEVCYKANHIKVPALEGIYKENASSR